MYGNKKILDKLPVLCYTKIAMNRKNFIAVILSEAKNLVGVMLKLFQHLIVNISDGKIFGGWGGV